MDDIVSYEFFHSDNLDYQYFIDIYNNEIKNYYKKDKIKLDNNINYKILESIYCDYPIAEYFNNLLFLIKNSIYNNVILIYFKQSKKVLFVYKSFEFEAFKSSYYYYFVELDKYNFDSLNSNFNKNSKENIIIIFYQK